jgi:putative hydrolase of the HAD superfamily
LKSVLNGISTIIFDLGGVVLNLDPDLTAKAFARLSGKELNEIYDIFLASKWVPAFERGEISPEDFRKQVKLALDIDVADTEIDMAWNAMLLELPEGRLNLLSGLRKDYHSLVLSNTNEIHIKEFSRTVSKVTNGESIHDHFHKVYYSNELGLRKPEKEIYQYVLEANNLKPSTTLFIDDMLPNIEAAEQCGIKTIHLTDQEDLFTLFD